MKPNKKAPGWALFFLAVVGCGVAAIVFILAVAAPGRKLLDRERDPAEYLAGIFGAAAGIAAFLGGQAVVQYRHHQLGIPLQPDHRELPQRHQQSTALAGEHQFLVEHLQDPRGDLGMNIVKAMEQTAYGDDTVIYLELQKTIKEINQSVSVEAALSHLQQRCSNKFLDKMVSVISKSFSAGNANLAENLRTINAECWLEKKHSARRMGEPIQNKLFVPTMLMFGGILVVVIVPAISSFNM